MKKIRYWYLVIPYNKRFEPYVRKTAKAVALVCRLDNEIVKVKEVI